MVFATGIAAASAQRGDPAPATCRFDYVQDELESFILGSTTIAWRVRVPWAGRLFIGGRICRSSRERVPRECDAAPVGLEFALDAAWKRLSSYLFVSSDHNER